MRAGSMRPDRLYLLDILAASEALGRFLDGVEPGAFAQDEVLQSAVLQKLTVLGEAAARLSPELRAQHAQIEWHLAIGLRNVVVHAYFAVDWASIWQTATSDVPAFASLVRPLLRSLPDAD